MLDAKPRIKLTSALYHLPIKVFTAIRFIMDVFVLNIEPANDSGSVHISYKVNLQEYTTLAEIKFVELHNEQIKMVHFAHEVWESVQFNSCLMERLKDLLLADERPNFHHSPVFIGKLTDTYLID